MAVTARYTEQPVSVLLEPGQRKQIDDIAADSGVSIAAVIRFALANRLSLADIVEAKLQVPNRG